MKKECDAGNVMIKMKKSTRRDEVFSRGAIQITESGEWILFRLSFPVFNTNFQLFNIHIKL